MEPILRGALALIHAVNDGGALIHSPYSWPAPFEYFVGRARCQIGSN